MRIKINIFMKNYDNTVKIMKYVVIGFVLFVSTAMFFLL